MHTVHSILGFTRTTSKLMCMLWLILVHAGCHPSHQHSRCIFMSDECYQNASMHTTDCSARPACTHAFESDRSARTARSTSLQRAMHAQHTPNMRMVRSHSTRHARACSGTNGDSVMHARTRPAIHLRLRSAKENL